MLTCHFVHLKQSFFIFGFRRKILNVTPVATIGTNTFTLQIQFTIKALLNKFLFFVMTPVLCFINLRCNNCIKYSTDQSTDIPLLLRRFTRIGLPCCQMQCPWWLEDLTIDQNLCHVYLLITQLNSFVLKISCFIHFMSIPAPNFTWIIGGSRIFWGGLP